jgi:hypothetical protein
MSYATTSEAIYVTLRDDDTLKAFLGVGDGDPPRVYREYPPEEPEVSAAKPAYLVFSCESSVTVEGSGYGDDELWQIRVIANNPDNRDDIEEHIKQLMINIFTLTENVDLSNRVHLGGGKPTSSPRSEFKREGQDLYGVNVRFNIESLKVS